MKMLFNIWEVTAMHARVDILTAAVIQSIYDIINKYIYVYNGLATGSARYIYRYLSIYRYVRISL